MLKTNQILFFDSEEFEDIANFYLGNGVISLAKKAIKMGLEQHPTSSILKLYQVEIFIIEDRLEEAEALVDEIFELEQNNEDVYIQKANIFSRRNKHEEAISCLEKALDFTEDPAEILMLLGMEHMHMDDHPNAIERFTQSLMFEEEDDYAALYNIVYCYEYINRSFDAIEFLNNYLEDNPYSEIGWHQLARLYAKEKDYSKALAAFDFAIFSDDLFVVAYFDKGSLLEEMGRYDEAIECYMLTLSMDFPSAHTFYKIGNCHEKSGRKDLGLQYYLKSIDEDPFYSDGWSAIIDFYIRISNYEKAQEYVERAIAIEADNVQYWKRYAKVHYALENYEEAEIGFKKALDYGNFELECWLKRSDILLDLGNHEDAILNLIQAKDFYPDNAEIEFRLSGLYFSIDKPRKGTHHLKTALSLEPEFLIILEELFPVVYEMKNVKQIITKYKNHCS